MRVESTAAPAAASTLAPAVAKTRVWDLPTRLFHWTLVLVMTATFICGEIGGSLIDWHMRGGYTVLALVLFRIVWGFVGSRYARFTSFVRGPAAIRAYLKAARADAAPTIVGHNPLGSLSVLALLGLTLAQATFGLFANDDIASEGPLAKFVSGATSGTLTRLHQINAKVLLVLVLLHLTAIAFYFFSKNDNLVRPMITGDKPGLSAPSAADGAGIRLRALIVMALAAGLVYYIVTR